MAKTDDEWKVLPHGPIERLAENLWRVQGSLPGFSMKRVMTIARMRDGRLVIHNGIAMNEPEMREIEAFGTPAYLLVPNGFHRLDAPAFKRRYPNLTVLAPKGSHKRVAEKVKVDGTYEDFPQDDTVRLHTVPGTRDAEGAMIVRSPDGTTLVLNDIVFNMDPLPDRLGRLITTALGSAPGPRISLVSKVVMIKDKRAVRSELERYAATPDLVRLIVSHDKLSQGPTARDDLRRAIAYL